MEILVLAGGTGVTVSGGGNYLSSVYRSLDAGVSWEVVAGSGSMWPARASSALVYDLANTRLAIMGGQTSGGAINDFWTADATSLFVRIPLSLRTIADKPLVSPL